jgi:hypothetical protein
MPIQLVHDWHIFSAAGNLSQTAFLEHCAAKYTGYIARLVVVSVEGFVPTLGALNKTR